VVATTPSPARSNAMSACCPMPRVLICSAILVAMIHGVSNGIRADDSEAVTSDPAATDTEPKPDGGLAGGCGAGPFHRKVVRVHSQPNLRHATPRYEVTFAVSPGDAALNALLEKPLPEGGIEAMNESPLRELHALLIKKLSVPVCIDTRALEDAGIDLDVPITSPSINTGSLGDTLTRVLSRIDMAAIVENETLTLTTTERANEKLIVGIYSLPTDGLSPRVGNLIDVIQSTVAPETWDTFGGQGAIRPLHEANELVISNTLDVHMETIAFMRAAFDTDLVASSDRIEGQVPVRVYRLRDATLAKELATTLPPLCNGALGKAGDPEATVTLFGNDRLLVQSASRPFQIYAGELIRSLDGIDVPGDFD